VGFGDGALSGYQCLPDFFRDNPEPPSRSQRLLFTTGGFGQAEGNAKVAAICQGRVLEQLSKSYHTSTKKNVLICVDPGGWDTCQNFCLPQHVREEHHFPNLASF